MTRRLISSGSTFEKEIGYSRAVVEGDWIFVSGTTGFDYKTMTLAEMPGAWEIQLGHRRPPDPSVRSARIRDRERRSRCSLRQVYAIPDRNWPTLTNS